MPANFPDSPSVGDRFTASGGRRFRYAGSSLWNADDSGALFRQRLINPAMTISQEWGDTSSASVASGSMYAADQWESVWGIAGTTISTARVATDPSFPFYPARYVRLLSAGASSTVGAGEHAQIRQWIEGIRIPDLMWGTANARPVIFRFWIQATIAGTYSFKVSNGTYNRSYVTPVVYYGGNTWQQFTISVPGDTSGTWTTDTPAGMLIGIIPRIGTTYQTAANTWTSGDFYGVPGSANFCSLGAATFNVALVEMYVDPFGSGVAPRFVMLPEADELRLCQRYWYRCYAPRGVVTAGGGFADCTARNPVDMRDNPSVTIRGTLGCYDASSTTTATSVINTSGMQTVDLGFNTAAAMIPGRAAQIYMTTDNDYLAVSARM